MKKITLTILFSCIISIVVAQDGNRRIGIGAQTSFPIYGLSAKIGFTDQIVGQAIIAPYSVSSGDFGYSISFYGVRGIYRFTEPDRFAVPYAFVGGGLIRSTLKLGSLGSSSANLLGWNLGAGLEFFPSFLDNLGSSVELGYGAMSVGALGLSINSITYGVGVHYYFK
jgi:hypothetical protein